VFTEAIHKQVNYVLLCALAFLLPFSMYQTVRFTGITIILLAANMLLSKQWLKVKFKDLEVYSQAILGLFLLSVFGYFFSENLKSAGQLLESRVILVALPLIYWVMGMPDKKLLIAMFWATYIGVLISSLLIFRQGLAPFTQVIDASGCFNCVVEVLIPMHRPYYGLIIVSIISFSLAQLPKLTGVQRFVIIVVNCYLLIILGFMMPKMVLLASVIGLLVIITRYLFDLKSAIGKIIARGAIIGVLVGTVFALNLVYNQAQESTTTLQTSVISRQLLWNAAFEELKNPSTLIFGVGLGDEADVLGAYLESTLTDPNQPKLNAHNQYLSEWIKFGIAGLVCILIVGVYPVYIAWKSGVLWLLFIAVVWALNLLTENYLHREAGLLMLTVLILPLISFLKDTAINHKNFGNLKA
jgi:hypothetical protein